MEKLLYNLAIAVKERRRSLGFGLKELADKARVSKSLLSKIANHRTIPSLPVLLRIARGETHSSSTEGYLMFQKM